MKCSERLLKTRDEVEQHRKRVKRKKNLYMKTKTAITNKTTHLRAKNV